MPPLPAGADFEVTTGGVILSIGTNFSTADGPYAKLSGLVEAVQMAAIPFESRKVRAPQGMMLDNIQRG